MEYVTRILYWRRYVRPRYNAIYTGDNIRSVIRRLLRFIIAIAVKELFFGRLCVCNFVTLLPPTKEEVNAFARVCLSVCLLARLLKNAWMDLDEMLRVDSRDMNELINFWARPGL